MTSFLLCGIASVRVQQCLSAILFPYTPLPVRPSVRSSATTASFRVFYVPFTGVFYSLSPSAVKSSKERVNLAIKGSIKNGLYWTIIICLASWNETKTAGGEEAAAVWPGLLALQLNLHRLREVPDLVILLPHSKGGGRYQIWSHCTHSSLSFPASVCNTNGQHLATLTEGGKGTEQQNSKSKVYSRRQVALTHFMTIYYPRSLSLCIYISVVCGRQACSRACPNAGEILG